MIRAVAPAVIPPLTSRTTRTLRHARTILECPLPNGRPRAIEARAWRQAAERDRLRTRMH